MLFRDEDGEGADEFDIRAEILQVTIYWGGCGVLGAELFEFGAVPFAAPG